MDNDLYHMIKGIKRVSGFLGSRWYAGTGF